MINKFLTDPLKTPIVPVPGMGTAKYSYETDPEAHPEEFKLRKNGRWVRAGESMRNGTGLSLDRREKYYDPHF